MPLTSKNDGPDVAPGQIVRMEWVITRLFPSRLNVVQVGRSGSEGNFAGPPPQSVNIRIGTRPAGLEMVGGLPMEVGNVAILPWRVSQVFPDAGTVQVERDGLGEAANGLVPVTISTGAWAMDLEIVDPVLVARSVPLGRWARAVGATVSDVEPDMLPYGFDPVGLANPPEVNPPLLTQLLPASAPLGSPDFTLRVHGEGFDADSVIIWNGSPEPTTLVSPTQVTTNVDMSTATVATPIPVEVENLAGVSNTLIFDLLDAVQQDDPPADPAPCDMP